MHINVIVEGLQNDTKLFADDTSISSVVKEKEEAAGSLKSGPGKSALMGMAMEYAA